MILPDDVFMNCRGGRIASEVLGSSNNTSLEPVFIAHGMMGSGANFASIAKQLHKKTGELLREKGTKVPLLQALIGQLKRLAQAGKCNLNGPHLMFTIGFLPRIYVLITFRSQNCYL